MAWPRVQDNRLVGGMLALLVLLAWWAMYAGEHAPWGHAVLHGAHMMRMNVGSASFAAVFVFGWLIMTVAMMLPTSTPLILLFHRMVAGRPHAAAHVALLIAAYLAVWALFGLLVFALNRGLYAAVRAVPWLDENGWAPGAAILLGAGLFQFSRLKYACLDKCRSPLGFMTERWRSRPFRDAWHIGAAHGLYCVGCCWLLMLVMFAVGTGGLAWMLLLAIVMAAEKNLPWGRRLSAPVGVLLIAGAVTLAISR